MESVTRSLYSRGDLDLVLSSPVPPRRLFAVRIAANAALIAAMAVMLSAPFIDVLVLAGGPRWLAALRRRRRFRLRRRRDRRGDHHRPVPPARPAADAARRAGRRRRRSAPPSPSASRSPPSFYYGSSAVRHLPLPTPPIAALPPGRTASSGCRPAPSSATGRRSAVVVAASALIVARGRRRSSRRASASIRWPRPTSRCRAGQRRRTPPPSAPRSPARALRRKEWLLLRRDPWLASQTLTQLLYLLPPALLLVAEFRQHDRRADASSSWCW